MIDNIQQLYAISIVTGQIFKIQNGDLKILFPYQIPLEKLPKISCKKCHGRGYTAINSQNNMHILCNCISKCILKGFDTSKVTVYLPRMIK